MIRTYVLRTSRKKWDIKFYTSHICSNFNCVSIKENKKKCNLSNKIFQTSINLYSYDKDNPRSINGNLLDLEEIVIPDSSFTIAIYFPLSYIFEIFIHSSQHFTRKEIINTIKLEDNNQIKNTIPR